MTDPGDVAWREMVALPSGVEAGTLWDTRRQCYARLGIAELAAWLRRYGYRLPTGPELVERDRCPEGLPGAGAIIAIRDRSRHDRPI